MDRMAWCWTAFKQRLENITMSNRTAIRHREMMTKHRAMTAFITYTVCGVTQFSRTETQSTMVLSSLQQHQFNDLFSMTTLVSWYHSGSGTSWTICKSFALCSRQTTTPAPHESILWVGFSSWCSTNSVKALKAVHYSSQKFSTAGQDVTYIFCCIKRKIVIQALCGLTVW